LRIDTSDLNRLGNTFDLALQRATEIFGPAAKRLGTDNRQPLGGVGLFGSADVRLSVVRF
jgi:hypothetical protein